MPARTERDDSGSARPPSRQPLRRGAPAMTAATADAGGGAGAGGAAGVGGGGKRGGGGGAARRRRRRDGGVLSKVDTRQEVLRPPIRVLADPWLHRIGPARSPCTEPRPGSGSEVVHLILVLRKRKHSGCRCRWSWENELAHSRGRAAVSDEQADVERAADRCLWITLTRRLWSLDCPEYHPVSTLCPVLQRRHAIGRASN